MRVICLAVLFALHSVTRGADNDLPKQRESSRGGKDAELFRNEAGDPLFPDTVLRESLSPAHAEPPPVGKAQTDFEQAQRKEDRWKKLGKAGVLSQVEVERATLQASRTRLRLEQARVAQQEADLVQLRQRAGSIPAETIGAAEAALQTARTMVGEANTALQQTERLIAESNRDRQQRLAALGLGPKSQAKRKK